MEQSVNNILLLKTFVDSIKPIWQALAGAGSEELQMIRQVGQLRLLLLDFGLTSLELCDPMNYLEIENLIENCINKDVSYSAKPLDLRGQRVFPIKVGSTRE